jgi:hypothetical protein
VKRSQSIRLILLGGLSVGTGALTGCAPSERDNRISTESVYTADTHIPGAGYYHPPFQGFYPLPYNHYDAQRKQYFYGGQWGPEPHRSIVNVSAPTAAAAAAAQAAAQTAAQTARPYIQRGGFGRSSGFHSAHS